MIDVLVPVLARPQNAKTLYESFRDNSSPMDELHFLCSPGDDAQIEACLQTQADTLIVEWDPGPGDYARKMRYGFEHTERPWVFLGADDIEFSPGWSESALVYPGEVIATNDLANGQVARGQFGTHCFVSRRYVTEQGGSADGPGVLLHTGYDHNFVDRELCHLAQSRGVFSFAKDSHVRHSHPLWHTAPMDSTYRKALAHFQADRDLFIERSRLWGYAGLSGSERNVARRRKSDILSKR